MDKQIEEIYTPFYNNKEKQRIYLDLLPYCQMIFSRFGLGLVENLYNLGYRKIPENAVVLTREEQQKYAAYKIIEPQIRGCLDRERELEKRLETIRKETAENFAEGLKEKLEENSPIAGYDLEDLEFDGEAIQECIDETVKEITEGNKNG